MKSLHHIRRTQLLDVEIAQRKQNSKSTVIFCYSMSNTPHRTLLLRINQFFVDKYFVVILLLRSNHLSRYCWILIFHQASSIFGKYFLAKSFVEIIIVFAKVKLDLNSCLLKKVGDSLWTISCFLRLKNLCFSSSFFI